MNVSTSFYICRTGFIGHKAFYCKNMAGSSSLNWEKIKIRYLEMKPEDKRSLYKCGNNYKTLSHLPTWEDYARNKTSLPSQISMADNYIINSTKNSELRKKISIYMGDIASLEVSARECVI